jgi:hypothetical protein
MKACLSAILLLISTSAIAASSVGHGGGGVVTEFAAMVAQYNRTGELFRIEGACRSACTMFLGIRNACLDPSVNLLFHAALKPSATQQMLSAYNPRLRAYVLAHHYLNTRFLHAISARELIQQFGYRQCPGT